jgi:predicted phosphatase
MLSSKIDKPLRKNQRPVVTVFHSAIITDPASDPKVPKRMREYDVRQYKLSTRGRGKYVWNVLFNDESKSLTEDAVLDLLKPFKYVTIDPRTCKNIGPLAFYI